MQKKRVLFINYSLHSGGIEKSLVTVLSLFDYQTYDVDLQLFANDGMFLDRVSPNVNLLPPLFPKEYKLNIRQAFFALMKKGYFRIALCRLLVSFAGLRGTMGERLVRMWNVEKRFIKPSDKEYDAVIAFMEGQPIYYAVTKVRCKNKIGFIHGDYIAMGLNKDFDVTFIKQLNALCTVSESCKTALDQTFPVFSSKFHVVYNIVSSTFMRGMANEPADFEDDFTGLRVLSIARLSHQKGLDLALPAVAALKQQGIRFKWYIIGVGPELENLRAMIQELRIGDCVKFMGERSNPYPYLKACDIYLQPSRFEGKSIAVDEAMVMCRPILLTDFSTAVDQIDSGKNGLIVPMDKDGIAGGLKKLLLSEELRVQFSKALAECDYTNEDEISKLYALIDEV